MTIYETNVSHMILLLYSKENQHFDWNGWAYPCAYHFTSNLSMQLYANGHLESVIVSRISIN